MMASTTPTSTLKLNLSSDMFSSGYTQHAAPTATPQLASVAVVNVGILEPMAAIEMLTLEMLNHHIG